MNDKVAIVTGGASGIGLATAKKLHDKGASVVIADINAEKLKEVANEIGCKYIVSDLSKREDCKALVDYTIKEYGKVSILVNIAGIQTVSPIEDFPEDKWDFMIKLMLTAPFLLTKYVWTSMKENGYGRIINLNSIHGLVASEYKVAYVAAKHGLMGLTKTGAIEGGPLGITVNSICPAYVKTPLVEGQIKAQAKTHGISEEQVVSEIMLSKAFVKKMLDPSEVAEVVDFLCSDVASSITGIALPIDGGWTAS
ncbi:MAG: 3-hydroxybutyrate dehydrogenase [Peptostreptococcaceae bacterium]|nr:3-hydroxybutyrate dehydrogenase [Peptostreptococcaceae bacterium]